MVPIPMEPSNYLSQAAIISLSVFVSLCILCFLAFTYIVLRQKLVPKNKMSGLFRRLSYDTFDSQTAAPSILLDEQFIQPPSSSCRSITNLSPIHEIHSESLMIPDHGLRRHSAPKTFHNFRRNSEKRFPNRPINSCIQFSNSVNECPTLHISINYIHTVELLRIVVDKVTGLPKGDPTPKIYTLRLQIIPKSRTSAYLSKPLVTPAAAGYPEFDHLFEYAVSLKRLERARIEATLFERPWSESIACGRRFTVGAIPYTSAGALGKAEVNLAELMKNYTVVGKAEFLLDVCLLKNNPEVMENMLLPLNHPEDQRVESEESEKE